MHALNRINHNLAVRQGRVIIKTMGIAIRVLVAHGVLHIHTSHRHTITMLHIQRVSNATLIIKKSARQVTLG